MRIIRTVLVIVLVACFAVPQAAAQEAHVADQATLDQIVAAHAQQADADRQAILRMLQRQPVREMAARVGLDIGRVETAVAALDGAELNQMAAQARAVDDSLAGGASSITISTTTIIIGLLILILIIVAV
jgi:hypothetical protein